MPNAPLRTYIFDLDGTLIDSLPGIEQALAAALKSTGRTLPPAALARAIGPPIRTIASRLDPTLTESETLEIERIYRAAYDDETWKSTTLFPGVESTLKTLRESGHPLFVLTNKPARPARRILDHFALTALFTDIVTRDPSFASKAAMLTHLIQTHSLAADQCLMVGDTPEDAEAAGANSMPFVLMTYGYGEITAPVKRLDSFTGLLAPEFRTA